MVKATYHIYGREGHRQRESFHKSCSYDFSTQNNIRLIEIENSDKTGTHDYSRVIITRNTLQDCRDEMEGQLSDGIFENSRTGKVELIDVMAI